MKKILITGITGFAGRFLAKHLIETNKGSLFGTSNSQKKDDFFSELDCTINFFPVNLLNKESVDSLFSSFHPDEIYHLAALASPLDSFKNPEETITHNILMQLHLLESLKKYSYTTTKMLVVSSADVYGIVDEKNLPISEHTEFRPANPYAVSKMAQDFLSYQYFLAYKFPIIRVRPFNHIGPYQSAHFVVSSFAKQIAEIEKGKKEPILSVGNLKTKRDLTDVRDVVRAYVLLMEKGIEGEVYNIGSGISHKIGDILDILLSFSKEKIVVQSSSDLFRPSDTLDRLCDNKKFVGLTGWKPQYTLEMTLKDTLDYWRNIV